MTKKLTVKNLRADYMRFLDGKTLESIAQEYKRPSSFIESAKTYHETDRGICALIEYRVRCHLIENDLLPEIVDNYVDYEQQSICDQYGISPSDFMRLVRKLAPEITDEMQAKRRQRINREAYRNKVKGGVAKRKVEFKTEEAPRQHWALARAWV